MTLSKDTRAISAKHRVLLIDDNPDVLASLSVWLMHAGCVIETALNGPLGIALAELFSPDVVIVDIGLPELDGYQVAQRIREHFTAQQTLIIALSGYAPDQSRSPAELASLDHYLIKPPNLGQLLKLITDYTSAKNKL